MLQRSRHLRNKLQMRTELYFDRFDFHHKAPAWGFLRRGSFCQTCCWTLRLLFLRRKEFPSTHCGNFLLGAADLTRSLLLESPPLFASDSGPLRAQRASLEGTGSRSPQSISVRRAIDCARGRRWWGSILMSDRWGTLWLPAHGRQRRVYDEGSEAAGGGIKGGSQGWMEAIGGLFGSPARRY